MAGITDAIPFAEKPSAVPAPSSYPVWAALTRELLAVALLVWLADAAIYHGQGFAGLATLLLAAPALLLLGKPCPSLNRGMWIIGMLCILLAARTIWLGSILAIVCGGVLLVAYALALHGRRPYLLDCLIGFAQLALAGLVGLTHYNDILRRYGPRTTAAFMASVLLPAGAVLLFATLFVLANPDVTQLVTQLADRLWWTLQEWSISLSEDWPRFGFWLVVAYLAIGLLRPLIAPSDLREHTSTPFVAEPIGIPQHAPLFASLRNMLLAVITLFTVYLVFEFGTLWFRKFPIGFYYAGYAHQGAFWLTVALALATFILSLIFRGRVLSDPRLSQLRRLAWIWSAQNLILALAVYHRMSIYIDFNGMTRMRMIGLFGISTVVVGFLLVLWKIVHNRDFAWLIQRQLLALATAIYVFALTPVDTIVHSYNVRQILAGDLAPAVQISVHPNSAEGFLVLHPLLHCSDPIIRDGIRALLAQQEWEVQQKVATQHRLGWTTYQAADELLLTQLRLSSHLWNNYRNDASREAALEQFHKYAYQWY